MRKQEKNKTKRKNSTTKKEENIIFMMKRNYLLKKRLTTRFKRLSAIQLCVSKTKQTVKQESSKIVRQQEINKVFKTEEKRKRKLDKIRKYKKTRNILVEFKICLQNHFLN